MISNKLSQILLTAILSVVGFAIFLLGQQDSHVKQRFILPFNTHSDTQSKYENFVEPAKRTRNFGPPKIVYARVPKTGSGTYRRTFDAVAEQNGVWWRLKPKYPLHRISNHAKFIKEYFTGDKVIKELESNATFNKLGLMGHLRFIDFDLERKNSSSDILWISSVRNPVDRFISLFRFRRRRQQIYEAVVRKKGSKAAEKFRNLTLDDCLRLGETADEFGVVHGSECGLKVGFSRGNRTLKIQSIILIDLLMSISATKI